MKKILVVFTVLALVCTSCAKKTEEGKNDASLKSFTAWIQKNYPNLSKTGHGVYILENYSGNYQLGSAENYPYIRLDYVAMDLSGNITDYSEAEVAQHMGTYTESKVYVPKIFFRGEGGMNMGLVDAIEGMDVGGERTVAIPGWLNSATVYKTEEEYIKNVSGTSGVYIFRLREQISDIGAWELDSLCTHLKRHYGMEKSDSLKYGFYYRQTRKPTEDISWPKDTTIKINYVGRLLNGMVFDTNVKDTAILYGLYSSSKSYGPSSVTIAENYQENTLEQSTVIDGFAYMLSKMHPNESGSGFFVSKLGYGTSGSGDAIPEYSPLQFDIQIVPKEQ